MAKKKNKAAPGTEPAAEAEEGVVTEGECQICFDQYGAAKCTTPGKHSASEDSAQTKS